MISQQLFDVTQRLNIYIFINLEYLKYILKDAKKESINKCNKWSFEGNAVKLKENNEIKWVVSAIAPS